LLSLGAETCHDATHGEDEEVREGLGEVLQKDSKGKVGKKLSKEAKAKLEAAQHIVEEEAAGATRTEKVKNSGPADSAGHCASVGFRSRRRRPGVNARVRGDRDAGRPCSGRSVSPSATSRNGCMPSPRAAENARSCS
ncbi:MAG: hypothetical protein IPH03_08615, partial [Tetrasphaera sp.]|nr:hypothetical protein [Tetrasphaera sp.]